jgi:hypothetical protein
VSSIFYRFDETYSNRGRRTLCNFYHHNEILSEQLLRIKSAQTVNEFEKLIQEQLRRNQDFSIEKLIEPYSEFKEILKNKTCLRTPDIYRSINKQLLSSREKSTLLPSSLNTTAAHKQFNEIIDVNDNKSERRRKDSINEFVYSATVCYENCINCYLNNLNTCNQRAEIAEQQSENSPSFQQRNGRKLSLKVRQIDDSTLVNQINKISIGSK